MQGQIDRKSDKPDTSHKARFLHAPPQSNLALIGVRRVRDCSDNAFSFLKAAYSPLDQPAYPLIRIQYFFPIICLTVIQGEVGQCRLSKSIVTKNLINLMTKIHDVIKDRCVSSKNWFLWLSSTIMTLI